MTTRTATARYDGLGKDGKGIISTQSGALESEPYSFGSRFGGEEGTNPEELIAAAHAGCFTMALSFALAKAGFKDGTLETAAHVEIDKEGEGFKITRSDLNLRAHVPGIEEKQLRSIADEAKVNCPVSKLLNAEIGLNVEMPAEV